ncbi:hypothetical protein [Nocardioides sp. CF8]|uniref:hypothetical protein n=1 Tax=Nocardioides sp. CF8 TaxID=110319 RepID=UPI0006889A3F|nr:hypothetical protein [Nocardioides sp. CF8]
MTGETTPQDETTSELWTTPPGRRAVWARRAGAGFLLLIVVLAGLDLLGPRTGETSAEADGYELRVQFPQVTRAGQPAPLHITVEALGGLGDTVQLRLCDELFDDLDFQNWYPNPAAETSQPPWVIYEFDPPPTGDVLEISLDARVAPGRFGAIDDCGLSVLVDDQPVVGASFTVWRMP